MTVEIVGFGLTVVLFKVDILNPPRVIIQFSY